MQDSNKIIKFKPPSTSEETQMDQIKDVVDYIVDNAPPEALIDISKQFLMKSFEDNPGKFQETYKMYREYMDNHKLGYGQLINFSINQGVNRCQ